MELLNSWIVKKTKNHEFHLSVQGNDKSPDLIYSGDVIEIDSLGNKSVVACCIRNTQAEAMQYLNEYIGSLQGVRYEAN